MASDDEKDVKKEKRKVGLAPIAKPLAGKKLSKKSLKVVKKGEASRGHAAKRVFGLLLTYLKG
jgi:hypothetical protein